jgi:hypothetical protein
MNLNHNPTEQQLRDLLARYDDRAASHVLWVTKTGEVQITQLPPGRSLAELQQEHPEMQLRHETFLAGNEYVGPEAAADAEWVSELFGNLVEGWRKARGQPEVTCLAGL